MFVEKCARCLVKGDKVMLFDVIYECRSALLCERCSIIENIPIITKPVESQIKKAEEPLSVYDRMKKMAGIIDGQKPEFSLREERLKELESHPELEVPVEKVPDLIDYFHWEIMRNRRRRGIVQEKLAEKIGVNVRDIGMLEKGIVPPNGEEVIRKLESFFNIRLMKRRFFEEKAEAKPVLLDEYGRELEAIPEPEIEVIEIEDEELEEEEKKPRRIVVDRIIDEDGDLDINRVDFREIRIGDLRELHKKRVEVSKEEKRQEQKKIQERESLIEARKEDIRLLKEKESKDIDSILGGAELLNLNKVGEVKEETQEDTKEKENKIDKLFDEAFKE